MTAPFVAALGAYVGASGPVPKPAGLMAATPYKFVCLVTWFFEYGVPAMTGWDLLDSLQDGVPSDKTCAAMFIRDVANVDDEPDTYSVELSAGSEYHAQIVALGGDIAAGLPSFASQAIPAVDTTIEPQPLSATDDGALLVFVGGCWNFGCWQEQGFGGGQIYPAGWVPTLGPSNGDELGGFTRQSLPTGPVASAFGSDAQRVACIAAIFEPATPGMPVGDVLALVAPGLVR